MPGGLLRQASKINRLHPATANIGIWLERWLKNKKATLRWLFAF